MINQIALITILTDDVPRLSAFYRDVMGFTVKQDLGVYVEFHNDGVRFAICARSILHEASGHASTRKLTAVRPLSWPFPCGEPAEVDRVLRRDRRARCARRSTLQPICRGGSARPCSPIPMATSTNCLPICPNSAARRSVVLHADILTLRKGDLRRLVEIEVCGRIAPLSHRQQGRLKDDQATFSNSDQRR